MLDPFQVCRQVVEASYTFAHPIGMLPERLNRAVTCAYVLCRVADTVEDDPRIAPDLKRELFDAFLGSLERGEDPALFVRRSGDDRLFSALELLRTLPASHQAICVRWVSELARGMAIYCLRPPGSDGIVALTTLSDLERYCHFAAGTVGLLLCDLFLEEVPGILDPDIFRDLGETYGSALQFVNSLRDIPSDIESGRCFIPRTACAGEGLALRDVISPACRAAAHRVLQPLYARAWELLPHALSFGLAIPDLNARMACLIPLWLAVPTLQRHEGNDEALIPGRSLRLSREEAMRHMQELRERIASPEALRQALSSKFNAQSSKQDS
jgi:farnesyl-diphosphate farnesyltransferase